MLTTVRDDLRETGGESPFPGLTTHAYLWTPPDGGNVLFYSTVTAAAFDDLERLGGVAHQYLSHQDEAGPLLADIARRFGSRLHAPRGDETAIAKAAQVDVWLDGRGTDANGVEVVPTPGHTPGSTCYVVTGSAGERYLFTGDTVYLDGDGRWAAGNLPFSDPTALAESIDLLGTLEPDVVISSAAPTGVGSHEVSRADWPAQMQELAATLA
jgi:hydroxyacylglutathione hydrolase